MTVERWVKLTNRAADRVTRRARDYRATPHDDRTYELLRQAQRLYGRLVTGETMAQHR